MTRDYRVNAVSSKLQTAMSDVATTFEILAGMGIRWSTSYPYFVVMEGERCKVTNKSIDTFSVERAQNGTVAERHEAGTVVRLDRESEYSSELEAAIGDVGGALDAHVIAADPHPGYLKESDTTGTPTASKVPIADGSGKLDSWVTAQRGQASSAPDTTPLAASAPGTGVLDARNDHAHRSPGGVASITSEVSVASSITVTQLVGITIPAGLMAVGTTFRIRAFGLIGDTSSAPTATWRVRIGAASLGGNIACSIVPTLGTSLSNKPWRFEALVTVRASGGSGTCIANGGLSGEYSTTLAQAVKGTAQTATVAVDTTLSRVLELTFQFGTSNASNILKCENAVIEVVKM